MKDDVKTHFSILHQQCSSNNENILPKDTKTRNYIKHPCIREIIDRIIGNPQRNKYIFISPRLHQNLSTWFTCWSGMS